MQQKFYITENALYGTEIQITYLRSGVAVTVVLTMGNASPSCHFLAFIHGRRKYSVFLVNKTTFIHVWKQEIEHRTSAMHIFVNKQILDG